MTKLPKFESYGPYNGNYGAHALKLTMGCNTFWFSYQTLVAFRAGYGNKIVVHENDWGPTTGKHLNAIDGGNKQNRVSAVTFQAEFAKSFPELV